MSEEAMSDDGEDASPAPAQNKKGDAASANKKILHLLPNPEDDVSLPVVVLAHHHHIIHFVDVDPAYCPPRQAANTLSNSCTDLSNHYHTSIHQHRLLACKLHVPSSERESVYWEPYVRMRSSTVATFSNFAIYDDMCYAELSHHFIHVHDVYCKDICLNPQGDPHKCPSHPKGDHECALLHFKARVIDEEGFSRATASIETGTQSFIECRRWIKKGGYAHFKHCHRHDHTLVITLAKGSPSEGPHDHYKLFLDPEDSLEGEPNSPFST